MSPKLQQAIWRVTLDTVSEQSSYLVLVAGYPQLLPTSSAGTHLGMACSISHRDTASDTQVGEKVGTDSRLAPTYSRTVLETYHVATCIHRERSASHHTQLTQQRC